MPLFRIFSRRLSIQRHRSLLPSLRPTTTVVPLFAAIIRRRHGAWRQRLPVQRAAALMRAQRAALTSCDMRRHGSRLSISMLFSLCADAFAQKRCAMPRKDIRAYRKWRTGRQRTPGYAAAALPARFHHANRPRPMSTKKKKKKKKKNRPRLRRPFGSLMSCRLACADACVRQRPPPRHAAAILPIFFHR